VGAGFFDAVALRIEFTERYPDEPPRVFDHDRRWRPCLDRHMFESHEFCLWLEHVDEPDVSTPEGLRTFLLRLLPFLRDQFVYDDLDRWPGLDWPHGPGPAYAQHVIERLGIANSEMADALWPALLGYEPRPDRRCPCGSPLVYGHCHRERVRSLLWIRELDERDELPARMKERLRDVA
jgi:hypothetical protein